MSNKNIILSLTVLLMMTFLTACQNAATNQNNQSNDSINDLSNNTEDIENTEGWNFSINTTDLHGIEITEEDFSQNKLTVLNVWATWCPPCIDELPELQEISEAFESQGVQIVGVLQDGVTDLREPNEEVIENALKLLDNANAIYPVILPDETLTTKFISTMQYFPTTFFVDNKGTVIRTVIGAKNFQDWSDEINDALEQMS